jgi:hypothetical protein
MSLSTALFGLREKIVQAAYNYPLRNIIRSDPHINWVANIKLINFARVSRSFWHLGIIFLCCALYAYLSVTPNQTWVNYGYPTSPLQPNELRMSKQNEWISLKAPRFVRVPTPVLPPTHPSNPPTNGVQKEGLKIFFVLGMQGEVL